MGLSAGAHQRSLLAEMNGLLALACTRSHAGAVAAGTVYRGLAILHDFRAHRAAQRAEVSEVLRLPV